MLNCSTKSHESVTLSALQHSIVEKILNKNETSHKVLIPHCYDGAF